MQDNREIVTSVGCVHLIGTQLPFGCVGSVDPTGIQPPFGLFADPLVVPGVLLLSAVLSVFGVFFGLDFSGTERFDDMKDCTSINTLGFVAIASSHSLVL